MSKNLLRNASFIVYRDGTPPWNSTSTPPNNNATYLHGGWILLSEGDDVVDVEEDSTSGRSSGSPNVVKFVVQTAGKKFGYFQVLPWPSSRELQNGLASFSLLARSYVGAEIPAIHMAILRTVSASKDAAAIDPISAWNAAGQAPTWHSDWEAVAIIKHNLTAQAAYPGGTPASWPEDAIKKLEGVPLPEEPEGGDSGNNYGVIFWADGASAGNVLEVGWTNLESGAICTPFVAKSFADDIAEYQHFARVFTMGVSAFALNSTTLRVYGTLSPKLRDKPNMVLLAQPTFNGAGASNPCSGGTITSASSTGEGGFYFNLDGFTGLIPHAPYYTTSSAKWLMADAEIGKSL